jgi:hypothetical protein
MIGRCGKMKGRWAFGRREGIGARGNKPKIGLSQSRRIRNAILGDKSDGMASGLKVLKKSN